MKTAVALCIFNRPETTARVFAAITAAQPPVLLVVADGPRANRPGEAEKCAAARAIIEQVNWPCEVRTNFAATNLGVKHRMASGVTWVFEQVEEAIILEDDILPDPTFFRFCEELLERYRDDERVGYIGGHNVLFGKRTNPYSYYFTYNLNEWGWASWRRAWQYYDVEMKLWGVIGDQGQIPSYLRTELHPRNARRWNDLSYRGEMTDKWDNQWGFACRAQSMLAITPSVPLIKNLGLGADATTTTITYKLDELGAEEMQFPLAHPPYVLHDVIADRIADTASGVPLIVKLALNTLPPKSVRRVRNIAQRLMAARRALPIAR